MYWLVLRKVPGWSVLGKILRRLEVKACYILVSIFTTYIRRMGEGTVFGLSVHTSTGGGLPHIRSRWGGTPLQVQVGVPHFRSRLGVPHPSSRGYSIPDRGKGYPILLMGGTPSQVQGVPYPVDVVLPSRSGWGTPHQEISIASTCYVVGSVPLAFTQEDFLVH